MALPDTRTKVLDAAERLFAENGYRGTSVRAITDLAGANLASVAYHFGSKAELMAAVVRRVVEPINKAQHARLDEVLARTADRSVADLVEAFVGPRFDEMPANDAGGARTSRLIMTSLGDPAEEARSWTGPAEAAVRERFLSAFARALPGVAPQELWFRLRGILAVTAVDRVEVYNQPTPSCSAAAGEEAKRWAVTFLTAAMSAPATEAVRQSALPAFAVLAPGCVRSAIKHRLVSCTRSSVGTRSPPPTLERHPPGARSVTALRTVSGDGLAGDRAYASTPRPVPLASFGGLAITLEQAHDTVCLMSVGRRPRRHHPLCPRGLWVRTAGERRLAVSAAPAVKSQWAETVADRAACL
ncbi:TetR/AcrR family transcriptional regulator [[Kitasatospora] papulosa]|uniref:TetR/AcrR family transcriptional regulator n=1 Tax=[Kitasatospora] papulosa TaxID=1464011 RepID=UPI00368AAA3E